MFNISNDFEYRKFDEYLDNVRLNDPNLAALLDDILEINPNLRLFDLQENYKKNITIQNVNVKLLFSNIKNCSLNTQQQITRKFADIYNELRLDLEVEFNIAEFSQEKKSKGFGSFVLNIMSLLSGDYKPIARQFFSQKRAHFLWSLPIAKTGNNYRFRSITKRNGIWAIIAQFSHLSVLVASLIIISNYIGVKIIDLNKFSLFKEYFTTDFTYMDIAGVAVLLSFSFIAVRYYVGIYGNLDPKKLKNGGKLTYAWLRFSTLYWPIPIFAALFFDRHLWTFVASFGTFVVTINNYLNYRLAKISESVISKQFNTKTSLSILNRIKEYKGWWILMFTLSMGLLVVGVLLRNDILHDELAYMTIVFMINIKMWAFNCTESAYDVNKTLQFLYTRYDRALKHIKLFGEVE